MSGCFVYILLCADGALYTGWTNDPEKRWKAHSKGTASRCTRARRPIKPVYLERLFDKSDAMKREAAIKKLSRAEKLTLIKEKERESIINAEKLGENVKIYSVEEG